MQEGREEMISFRKCCALNCGKVRKIPGTSVHHTKIIILTDNRVVCSINVGSNGGSNGGSTIIVVVHQWYNNVVEETSVWWVERGVRFVVLLLLDQQQQQQQ